MSTTDETRFLRGVFRDPKLLEKKLVLAIALAPPKSRVSKSARGVGVRRRPRRR